MSATFTSPVSSTLNPEPGTLNGAPSPNPESRAPSPRYSPSGDDLLIYEWVKMQGKTQEEVARLFSIDQSTVSRIIQRYERWQAHANARENGRLSPHERLRAQRWLTYERNELILASCLRIAHEMEGFTELSKSSTRRPLDKPSQKSEVRTEERVIDRHGVAARFLRLAYRINMDQLKLAELFAREGQAPAEPLTDEELAADAHQAALDAAEIAAARQQASDSVGWDQDAPASDGPPLGTGTPGHHREAMVGSQPGLARGIDATADLATASESTLNLEPETLNSAATQSLHNLHNDNPPEIAPTTNPACTCAQQRPENNSPCTCIKAGPSGHRCEALVAEGPAPHEDLPLPISLWQPTADTQPTAAAT